MQMKDFLGNEYGVGDKVLYAAMSGRSVTIVLAEVVSITKHYRNIDKWDWVKIGLDEEVPFRTRWNRETRQDEPTNERVETEIRVSVQPLNSSRWKQHYGRTRYIDTRTGKGIDPFSGSGKHMVGNYYERQSDGERVYYEDAKDWTEFTDHYYAGRWYFGAPDAEIPEGWRWVKQEFKNYVKKIEEGPKPVTLSITDNIVLWQGKTETNESHPEWKACK